MNKVIIFDLDNTFYDYEKSHLLALRAVFKSQKYFDSEDESDSAKSIEDEAAIEKESSIDSSELSSDLDDLLDEIDQVLESNAEEFVKSYVQKGGQ